MNVKTVKPFTDKDTDEVRYVGDEFECSKERFDVLHAHALVEKVGAGGIDSMTMPELDEYAANIGIDTKKIRKKADKVAAIEAAETSIDKTDDTESEEDEKEE